MQNKKDYDKEKILEVVERANHIAIVPSKVSGPDSFCAGAGLYHMLKARDKKVTLIYPGVVPAVCKDLVPEEAIDSNTSHRKLLIDVDYTDTPAAKVEYANEDNVLHLVISPVSKDFNLDRVHTRVSGFDFDLVFMLGVQGFGDLGYTYTDLREELEKAKIINIDNTKMNIRYGHENVIDVYADDLSTLVFKVASNLGFIPNAKAAKALLVGMTYRAPKV